MAGVIRSRRRTLATIVGVAVGALALGLFAGTQVQSAADAASDVPPPEASKITVPVELRALENTVVGRGDAGFAGAVDITLETGGDAPAVVTGQVPKVGNKLDEGDVVLEVAGRPVLVLEGELPMYRSLAPGMSGPDVEQLEETLQRLGLNPGAVDDQYTAVTGQAVAALFKRAGYPAPEPDAAAATELETAETAVDEAEEAVAQAERELARAGGGPSEEERVAAQNDVDAAQRALEEARRGDDANAIADAEDALELAEAKQRDLLKPRDTSAEKAALKAAKDSLDKARTELSAAQARAGTPLPADQIVYVPSLPRRVDEVKVKRGDTLSGAVMSVSGAELNVTVRVDAATRRLLSEDMAATIGLPSGDQAKGKIIKISKAKGEDASGFEVVIKPQDLSASQVEDLRSANVKVTIPVDSTDGEVIAVPLAALTAGPGGESRVEVQRDGRFELVEVEVGLSAEGYAEVTPVEAELAAGDLVVVGRTDAGEDDGESEADA